MRAKLFKRSSTIWSTEIWGTEIMCAICPDRVEVAVKESARLPSIIFANGTMGRDRSPFTVMGAYRATVTATAEYNNDWW